ncbi:hypothetical protein EV121DRAFT_290773 [Schizophyllum commune]
MAADARRPSIGSPRRSLDGARPPAPTSPPPASASTHSAPTPPYYILLSHSGVLAHAPITYHYADDPALALLPESPGEHVVLLDWALTEVTGTANASPSGATAGSTSGATTAGSTSGATTASSATPLVSPSASTPSARIAHSESTIKPDDLVMGEKVTAQSLSPSLAVTGVRVEDVQSHRMYVVETTEGAGCAPPADTSAEALVATFKQRNAALQRVLDYPSV